jgi:hypothetical protein
VSFPFDDYRSAMCADVRQAPDDALVVRREYQRLIETALEQRERRDSPGSLYALGISDPLPAARKDAVLLELEVFRIGVHARGKRRCAADVLVDVEIAWGHPANLALSLAVARALGSAKDN